MLRGPGCLRVLFASGLVVLGCSAGADKDAATPALVDSGKVTDTSLPGEETAVEDDGGFTVTDIGTPDVGGTGCIGSDPDCDGDGYKVSEGDCNDKDGTINPDAYDFPDDMVDNDCDGTADNPVTECAATAGAFDGMQFARAADLCPQRSKSKKTGAIYDPVAKVEFGGATKAGASKIVTAFGENKPRRGTTLFGLQNGPLLAADPRKSSAMDFLPTNNACAALPLKGDDCKSLSSGTISPFGASVQDIQEVRMFIRVPSNAKAMVFDFAFFSTEFNEFWNSSFNDAFFVLVTSKKIAGMNVAKDSKGKALTVNSGFFQLCPKPDSISGLSKPEALKSAPCVGTDGSPGDPGDAGVDGGDGGAGSPPILGTLKGTNFDGAGAGSMNDTVQYKSDAGTTTYVYGGGSGWLSTKFEVEPGESMVVRFLVMDTGDGILDSAAIVDNIRWEKAPPKVPTGEVERPPK